MTKDIETLSEILAMTTSSNDHECLVAVRRANAMLAGRNTTWEMFLKGRYPREAFSPENEKDKTYSDADDINEMWEVVLMKSTGSFLTDWAQPVYSWWEKKGFLTEKQYNGLKNSYEFIMGKRR